MIEERIPVQIFGQAYEIIGNSSDALYYHSLARFVEAKMKEVQDAAHVVSTQKIAVLAALNIADELFRERENKSLSGTHIEKKHEDLIKLLNQALQEPSDNAAIPKELSL